MLDTIVEFESPKSAAVRDSSPADNTLFSRFGVEIEYMVVDRRTLDVRPVVNRLLTAVGGPDGEFCNGAVTWSNELVNHVLELKLTSPADSLTLAAQPFQAEVPELNAQLAEHGCILLPTGMHPWMDPARETRLWPNAGRDIYEAYDRIFNCRRHGWANLQSVHLNLPFASDDEFRRLHSAVRLLLPLLPALSASSPFFEGLPSTWLDTRMEVYRTNSVLVPSVTGDVVPELITNREDYESQILRPIYDEVRPHDPEGTLADDWMNARGAIARFERGTIEIRVLDTQECPAADLAILQFVVAILQELVNGSFSSLDQQEEPKQSVLVATLADVIRSGRAAEVSDRALLRALGLRRARRITVGRIWSELLGQVAADGAAWVPAIERILSNGCLAERIICATGEQPSRSELESVYSQLANCLARGEMFFP